MPNNTMPSPGVLRRNGEASRNINQGACMTMKSKIVKYHRHNAKQHDALTRCFKKKWRGIEEYKLTKIRDQFTKILSLVIQ